MTRPRMTREPLPEAVAPACPHCGDRMDDSTLTLSALVEHWPLPERIAVEGDGYAHGHQRHVVTCGWCGGPSALAFDGKAFKLVAMRTAKDDRYLSQRESAPGKHAE